MLVVADSGQPIDNAWRIEHEPARHKLLDLIGDLALLGRPLHATVVARKSGHALTHELVRRILSMA
jgi:UDP-3-O-acyl-N-acetylglucosamine deacetylase